MLLEIERAVFDTPDHPPVVKLLDLIAEQRHEWRPPVETGDAAERFVTTNLPNTPALVELIHKCVVEAANPAPAGMHRATVAADRLRQLVEDLGRSAVLVVEDAVTEECFLLAVARAFRRTRIVEARRRHWLEFSHSGGSGRLPAIVARRRAEFHLLVRVAALLDSDRLVPRQRTPQHGRAERVRAHGADVHVWSCRELENYVPRRVWVRHFPDRHAKIGMLLAMRPDQRGHLDLKHGLRIYPEAESDVATLFADLPDEAREAWRTGFASSRRGMPSPLVPDELVLTEEDFAELGPSVVAELRAVLAMIERIL